MSGAGDIDRADAIAANGRYGARGGSGPGAAAYVEAVADRPIEREGMGVDDGNGPGAVGCGVAGDARDGHFLASDQTVIEALDFDRGGTSNGERTARIDADRDITIERQQTGVSIGVG